VQTRQSLILGSAVVVAALILGAFFGPRTEAQKTELGKHEPAAVGRYQFLQAPNDLVVVLDTATGQCWYKPIQAKDWEDLGSPAQPKK
jgi:hypothetical protein